jgi:putative endonuclease
MPHPTKVEVGRRIEARAQLWYLENYPQSRLIDRNWRCRGGELDLVFEDGEGSGERELAFVEVRFRDAQSAWETPLESVGPAKLRRLRRAMGHYLMKYRGRARSLRLDVLEWDGREWRHRRSVI